MELRRSCCLWLGLGLLAASTWAGAAGSRSEALEALCRQLEVGIGAVIADVGCGEGLDSLVFARVVGGSGTVLAQEIDATKLTRVVAAADKRGFHQIVPVLGQSDDPRLPDGLASLIYMNRVFHHFSRPRAMLTRLWHDLKPGGYLVIVDQQKGPLTDWAPMERREDEHHWTGETTVVRLAREAGFRFHDALDDLWHERQPFVLVFQRPAAPSRPAGDPDLPRPVDADRFVESLPLAGVQGAVVFCGLDGGRAVAPQLAERLPAASRWFELIPEEWAVSREELPDPAPGPADTILRVEQGRLTLPGETPVGLVVFVDSYHRLWDPVPLLRQLRERMTPSGRVVVADRAGPDGESRRLSGHRRRLSAALVTGDLREAGFEPDPQPAAQEPGRLSLRFRARPPVAGE